MDNTTHQGAKMAHPSSPASPYLSPKAFSDAEGCSLAEEMDKPLDSPCVIFVPSVAQLREGSFLVGSIKIGRFLGAGLQARVHELTFRDGTPTGKVVKISHLDIGHKALNAVWIPLEREWEVGLFIRCALQDESGKVQGFMKVCDALVSGDDPETTASGGNKPSQRRRARARVSGMVLEKLDGWEVYKRIDDHAFHNIHYLKEMLRQVFNALDRAERETGLFHADLGQRNVMEHYPELYPEPQAEQTRKNIVAEQGGPSKQRPLGDEEGYEIMPGSLPTTLEAASSSAAAEITSSSSRTPTRARASGGNVVLGGERVDAERIPTQPADSNLSVHSSIPSALNELPPSSSSSAAASASFRLRPRPGYTCNGDGSHMPLGPRIEFKIIDYGSSYFSEDLAQATGGFRARRNYHRLKNLFESRKVAFRSSTRTTLVEVETAAGKVATAPGNKEKKWHLIPTGNFRQRFHLKAMKEADVGTPNDLSSSGGGNQEEHHPPGPERLHSFKMDSPRVNFSPTESTAASTTETTTTTVAPSTTTSPQMEQSWTKRHLRTLSTDLEAAAEKEKEKEAPLAPSTPTSNIIEILYRHYWRRKGDVFHLLLSLAIALDDRLWPKEDKEDVQLFISLVYQVTGVKLKASFAAEGEPAATGLWGTRRKLKGKSKKFGSREAWGSWFRRVHIRLKAHFFPYNSGTTAGQALVAPFFQEKEEPAPPAAGAASLEKLFPRSGLIE